MGNGPDVMLIGAKWPERALLRAQLIEQGYEVVAFDTGPIPPVYRLPRMKPRVLVIDLHELPDPRRTLDDVRSVVPPGRVLVVRALASVDSDEIRPLGFNLIERPVTIGEIVSAAAALIASAPRTEAPADGPIVPFGDR